MSLTHWHNGYPSTSERIFDEVFNPRAYRRERHMDAFRPKMDVHQDTNNFLEKVNHDEEGYGVHERHFGKSSRSLSLPQSVKNDEIRASMADGVLTVVFPEVYA
ncbi:hypothetical protein BC834DRAFT_1034077 [Gloeopeniophorella convolvens]|nr:hypothetical protein BC834DRAFT_1034077 [Gloeopeniophorella convolvens]